MMKTNDTVNWALVGTGNIVKKFLIGLRAAEGARAAAVVSRSQDTADRFAREFNIPRGYGSYEEMLADPEIDAVYIGTPHSTHRDYAVKAFEAKKAVLCEKPVCINAGEMAEIIASAKSNGVFFMEAMWTRFLPAVAKVRSWLEDGLIGDVKMAEACFGFTVPWNPEGRLLNINLGGGALLDAGVYPISFASMVFGGGKPETVSGLLSFGETGVDEQFTGTISYGGHRMAAVSAAIRTTMVSDAWIYGTLGRIHLPDFVFGRSSSLIIDGKYIQRCEPDFISNGYNYEVEEVQRCLRAGQTESPVMPPEESLRIMETMDAVRSRWDFRYPFE
ncbi:Gfo/Idh/MocA family protein [Breznakiella homolactica]|uniref:Gfo/Idh/MocA family oxidoreductase n=1 Tax=Breznakiella homolactica TaxID=2798577 RepID=A0A7T7XRP8_9SPIR|nr:Gfo/Idh/MocA family oxidoreductase [Breznakiella homolactica]QQO11251.1 Gfo/Idh/MocA family oxidoreductase [Breznakiella homolactica]